MCSTIKSSTYDWNPKNWKRPRNLHCSILSGAKRRTLPKLQKPIKSPPVVQQKWFGMQRCLCAGASAHRYLCNQRIRHISGWNDFSQIRSCHPRDWEKSTREWMMRMMRMLRMMRMMRRTNKVCRGDEGWVEGGVGRFVSGLPAPD